MREKQIVIVQNTFNIPKKCFNHGEKMAMHILQKKTEGFCLFCEHVSPSFYTLDYTLVQID